jgi:hypothetical protein
MKTILTIICAIACGIVSLTAGIAGQSIWAGIFGILAATWSIVLYTETRKKK